jgi:hypothetical protein
VAWLTSPLALTALWVAAFGLRPDVVFGIKLDERWGVMRGRVLVRERLSHLVELPATAALAYARDPCVPEHLGATRRLRFGGRIVLNLLGTR